MDHRTLQSFLALAGALHFGRAAEACHMSPSTLSRAIQQLEAKLGVTLFERDNRTVSLTPDGDLFRRYARESLQHWENFQSDLMAGTRELTGELSLYCSVTASYSFLHTLLAGFRRRHPRIRIKLLTGDPEQSVARVMAGDAELSIGARPAAIAAGLVFKPITTTPLVFIAPRDDPAIDALLRERMRAADWARVPMIVPERGVARERVRKWFRDRGVTPAISTRVAGNEALVSMVSLGSGVGIVPRIVLDNSPLAAKVRIVSVKPALAALDVGLFALKKRLGSRLIGAFWNALDGQNTR